MSSAERTYHQAQSRKIPEVIYQYMDSAFSFKPIVSTDKVLEVGVGNGETLSHLLQFTPHVYGIDALPEATSVARRRNPQSHIVVATAENIPFADDTFDKVVTVHTLEHVADFNESFSEINRVTKQGGENFHVFPSDYLSRAEGAIFDALRMGVKNPMEVWRIANQIHLRSLNFLEVYRANAPFMMVGNRFAVKKFMGIPLRFNWGLWCYKPYMFWEGDELVVDYREKMGIYLKISKEEHDN